MFCFKFTQWTLLVSARISVKNPKLIFYHYLHLCMHSFKTVSFSIFGSVVAHSHVLCLPGVFKLVYVGDGRKGFPMFVLWHLKKDMVADFRCLKESFC